MQAHENIGAQCRAAREAHTLGTTPLVAVLVAERRGGRLRGEESPLRLRPVIRGEYGLRKLGGDRDGDEGVGGLDGDAEGVQRLNARGAEREVRDGARQFLGWSPTSSFNWLSISMVAYYSASPGAKVMVTQWNVEATLQAGLPPKGGGPPRRGEGVPSGP